MIRNMFLQYILCVFTVRLTMSLPPSVDNKTLQGATPRAMYNIAKPNCPTKCGNVSVPYPFGIGKDTGCSLDESFYVTCNTSYIPPKLFLTSGNLDIYNISDSELRIGTSIGYKCYDKYGVVSEEEVGWINLRNFTFSEKNKFTVIGCDDYALITGREGDNFASGCIGLCTEAHDVTDGRCSGKGCCQTSITKGLKYYNVTLNTFRNHTDIFPLNRCGLAFLGEEDSFEFRGVGDLDNATKVWERIKSTVPVVVDWVIGPNRNCEKATECKENSSCNDIDGGGYRCSCMKGYHGNAYLDAGCQDIDECKDPRNNPCYGDCINTPGSYNCTCPSGTTGDPKTPNGCVPIAKDPKFPTTIFTIAWVVGLFAIISGTIGICFGMRRSRLMRLREKFFEQNGGVLLKQKIKSHGSHEGMTLFSSDDLRKATNKYSQEHVIGHGAYGVVYKGILSDKRVVAVKRSKLVDKTQAEQFINELMILTQVIHRNVVKLLGCCLEEEVPILVYEFISNNTLFHHIHRCSGGMCWLTWENRLRVAIEAAGALAYLHSETIMPIIHRDIKSSNILLDDNYNTKISDFGASRLVPLDHDQVTTLIQGTLGYLDPEYFHTSQLTSKSDVYSFGVVLAELITGKKPIGGDRINEEKNLATYFLMSMETNRLFEIVEPRLLLEGTLEQLQTVAELVKRCLNSQGYKRPTMKEVAVELEGLRKCTTHPWAQQQTREDTRSLILEVEQSDLYEVPLVSYTTNDWDSYSDSTNMGFQENGPR